MCGFVPHIADNGSIGSEDADLLFTKICGLGSPEKRN